MPTEIKWVEDYLTSIVPRGAKLIIRDPFLSDECRWFRAAIENQIFQVRNCASGCSRLKKWKETGADEFVLRHGSGAIRHLFSLSTPPNPITFNREYLPHIAAYARLVLEFGYLQKLSSFSRYRKFSKDLLFKKKGGWFETDAEFYDSNESLYLHVEAKKTVKETEKLVHGLNAKGQMADLSKQHAKELEYILDLKPSFLWVVGPGSVDPERYVYKIAVEGLNARFEPCDKLPTPSQA